MSLPPGPTGSPFAVGARFAAAPFRFLEGCARDHGDTFTLRLPGDPPRVVCSHPEDVKRIFALPADAFTAADVPIPLNLGDRSLLFLDGDAHVADRKLMVPPLHGEHLAGYVATMRELTAEAVQAWPRGRPFPLHTEMQRITLRVILRCVFGLARGPRIERLERVTTEWLDGTLHPAVFFLGVFAGLSRVRRFLEASARRSRAAYPPRPRPWRVLPWQRLGDRKAEVVSILEQEIEACRAAGEGRTDVLAMLLRARYDDGSPMSDAALVDQLLTLLVGGHETTANSLSWVFRHLLRSPDALARCRAELAEVCPSGELDAASVKRLRYLDACVQEAMRLSPIAPAVTRNLVKPLELRTCVAPAGSIVWAAVYLTHARPDVWPEPLAYRPERFLDARPAASEFLPFGGGRRRCIGMAFASLEMVVLLAEILRRADLRLAPDAKPEPILRGITISPADGLRVVRD